MRYLKRVLGIAEEETPRKIIEMIVPDTYLTRALVLQETRNLATEWQVFMRLLLRGYEVTPDRVESTIDYLFNGNLIKPVERPPLKYYGTTELGSRVVNIGSPENLAKIWASVSEPVYEAE